MTALAVWQLAALLIGVTTLTLLAAGGAFAIAEWRAMHKEGRHDA